jgi:hypothetical protein
MKGHISRKFGFSKEAAVAQVQLESQNPHLPAAMRPAASPVKITGEVRKKPGFFASL